MGHWVYVKSPYRSEFTSPERHGQIAEAIRLDRFVILLITILAAITGILLRDHFPDKPVQPAYGLAPVPATGPEKPKVRQFGDTPIERNSAEEIQWIQRLINKESL